MRYVTHGRLYLTGGNSHRSATSLHDTLRRCSTDFRNLPYTSDYVGVKVNAVGGVKVNVAALWLWGVKVNMGG